jgi:hypothetical protein
MDEGFPVSDEIEKKDTRLTNGKPTYPITSPHWLAASRFLCNRWVRR